MSRFRSAVDLLQRARGHQWGINFSESLQVATLRGRRSRPGGFAFLATVAIAMDDQELLTASQAAEALSASSQTIRNWIRAEQLRAVRIGNRFLIPAQRSRPDAGRAALREHALAPPDAGFSGRITGLAAAARQRAEACEAAYRDGFEWPPARGGAKPPYELQPGTGRRGPEKLWARFDEAVAELGRVSEGRSLRAVGRAYAELADAASKLGPVGSREESIAAEAPQAVSERLLALVEPYPGAQRLVRRAWRSAQRLGTDLDLLWVRPPARRLSAEEQRSLTALRELASILGARLLIEESDTVPEAIANVARRQHTTYILMGRSRPARGLTRLRTPLPQRLMELLPGVDVRIVADRSSRLTTEEK